MRIQHGGRRLQRPPQAGLVCLPRLLRTASGHDPAAHLGGVPRDPQLGGCDHLELIVLNDTNEPYKGSWAVNRVDFDGNVLATQQIDDVELDAASHKGFPLNEEIVDFGDANNELIVAVPSDDSFARVIYNPAEILTQELDAPADAFTTKAKRTADGVELTVTANDYVRDLFCMVGKVDDKATVEEGLVSLLPGESVTFHIGTDYAGDPADFAAANVLRSANDLKRDF